MASEVSPPAGRGAAPARAAAPPIPVRDRRDPIPDHLRASSPISLDAAESPGPAAGRAARTDCQAAGPGRPGPPRPGSDGRGWYAADPSVYGGRRRTVAHAAGRQAALRPRRGRLNRSERRGRAYGTQPGRVGRPPESECRPGPAAPRGSDAGNLSAEA
eukprot:54633-Hanusia_phi.AAC.1